MNIKGKLNQVYPTKQVTGTFQKREFIVEYSDNPKYPQFIKFDLAQDNCVLIDQFKKGDMVDVHFDLTGRPWTNPQGETVYFNSLRVWKIEKADETNHGKEIEDFIPPEVDDFQTPF
jgi:hypothetical protein